MALPRAIAPKPTSPSKARVPSECDDLLPCAVLEMPAHKLGSFLARAVQQELGNPGVLHTSLEPMQAALGLSVVGQAAYLVHLREALDEKRIARAVQHDLVEPAAALEDFDWRKTQTAAVEQGNLLRPARFDGGAIQNEGRLQHRSRLDHNPVPADLLIGQVWCQQRDKRPTAARQPLGPSLCRGTAQDAHDSRPARAVPPDQLALAGAWLQPGRRVVVR